MLDLPAVGPKFTLPACRAGSSTIHRSAVRTRCQQQTRRCYEIKWPPPNFWPPGRSISKYSDHRSFCFETEWLPEIECKLSLPVEISLFRGQNISWREQRYRMTGGQFISGVKIFRDTGRRRCCPATGQTDLRAGHSTPYYADRVKIAKRSYYVLL